MLGEDASLFSTFLIPAPVLLADGSIDFTINGVSSGSTITMRSAGQNDGWFHQRDSGPTGSQMTINDITFKMASHAKGGMIFIDNEQQEPDSGHLTINTNGKVTFEGGYADETGGAIHVYNTLTINGGVTLKNNNAGDGGAIYVGKDFNASGGPITATNNSATGGGGGAATGSGGVIYVADGGIIIDSAATPSSFVGNFANSYGGALYAHRDISVNNALFKSNTSIVDGGAIYADGNITLSNVTLENNSATSPNSGYGHGGAVMAYAGDVTLDNVTLTGNDAAGIGGGVYAQGNLNANTVTATSNRALGANGSIAYGGALLAYDGDATITGTSNMTSNSAAYGGAIAAYTGNVIMSGHGNISNNTASGHGGAIFATTGIAVTADAGDITFDHNTAGNNGGALNSTGGVTLTATAGNINLTNNTATDNGGAIRTVDGDVALTGDAGQVVNLIGNTAGLDGGAIRSGANITLNASGASAITNNTAGQNGGALWASGNVTVNALGGDVEFSNNSATGGKGGAIWVGGNISLNALAGDIVFRNNTHGDPIANAIWLDNTNGATTATFDVEAGHSITFFDPIQNNAANGPVSVVKTGAGLLNFHGGSLLYGNTDIQTGTFEVTDHAVYGVQAADVGQSAGTTFSLGDGTTLQGGVMGTLRADAVTFGNDVTLNIAGRQPGTRGVFEIASPSLTLGSGNRVLFNTYLNDGVTQNTDLLRLNGTAVSGNADLYVSNVGGPGALTVGDGIMLVNVTNGGTTDDSTFRLAGRLLGGVYEYNLFHGGVADAGDGNWYLRSHVRPESGVYLHNLTTASSMFMHSLHDRLGEPQFTDKEQANGKTGSAWVRVSGSNTDSKAVNGRVDLNTDTTLVQFGGDLAHWSNNGNDRWLFGLMGAYGESDTDATTSGNGSRYSASGKVDGYSTGAYLTWYGNKNQPTGPYVDLWGMYGWYHNQVNGSGLPEESYRSQGWTVSAEAGYAFMARDGEKRQWMIEPQAQLAYGDFSVDDHRERNGTQITDGGWNGVTTRLGVRAYTRSKLGDNGMQPFVEANWWHDSAQSTLKFNGAQASDDTPDNVFELKAGIEGEIARHWQLWGHLGWRQGGSDYTAYEGMIGTKYQF